MGPSGRRTRGSCAPAGAATAATAAGAEKLLGEAAQPIESRLRKDDDGLRRHVLEAVSGGLIARREVMAAFDGALDAGPPLRWLAARGFLRPGGANWKAPPPVEAPSVLLDDTWEPTPLGAATVGAGLGPADALEVAAALRCRHGVDYGGVAPEYALLHRLYLTAPLQQNVLGGQRTGRRSGTRSRTRARARAKSSSYVAVARRTPRAAREA